MLPHSALNNGEGLDFYALQEHYEVTSMIAINLLKAKDVLKNLVYAGKKKPAMQWGELKQQLTNIFTIVHQKEKWNVYSNAS